LYFFLFFSQTAWHMLRRVLQVSDKDTVLVSAASGAVGYIACQLAKQTGAKVVALCGSDAKREKLSSFCDHVINYTVFENKASLLADRLSSLSITAVCDNTGGWILNAALLSCCVGARFAVCGRIAAWESDGQSLIDTSLLLTKQLRMEGFTVPKESFPPAREVG
jgi:NADPH-dependent curcumin reductase CurA